MDEAGSFRISPILGSHAWEQAEEAARYSPQTASLWQVVTYVPVRLFPHLGGER